MIYAFNWASILFIKRILFISVFAALLSISLINSPCVAQVPVKSSDWIDAELFPIMDKTEISVNKNFGSAKMVLRKNGIVELYGFPQEKKFNGVVIISNNKWTATEDGILTVYSITKLETKESSTIFNSKLELKLQGLSECHGSLTYNINGSNFNVSDIKKVQYRVVFAKKEPVNPNVVDNKPMPTFAQNESLINKSAINIINKALSESKGNIARAEKIVQDMRRESQEASDNPALIRAQYWLKGRSIAEMFGEPIANLAGAAYLSAKEWGTGFDSLSAWYGRLPWKPAPYDPATLEWFNNGVQNILPAK